MVLIASDIKLDNLYHLHSYWVLPLHPEQFEEYWPRYLWDIIWLGFMPSLFRKNVHPCQCRIRDSTFIRRFSLSVSESCTTASAIYIMVQLLGLLI